ncbi:MAG TPA: DUF6152 family protein [Gammaproteobacteria bacterium]|nr:DUF6152 family protein [Gammaproteobacteria bacterium]
MKTMQRLALIASGLLAASLGAAPAFAHHSTAAFDNGEVIKIEGQIKQFRWINPHASIKIEGKASNGINGLWTIEMTAPNVLINEGWTRDALKPGDQVTMYASPLKNAITLKDGSQGGLYVGVVLANGSTLGRVDGKPPENSRN